tara:strand:+ start:369 stop:773 length:405 start_codon:yes stop_codon:yes gene_type:complete
VTRAIALLLAMLLGVAAPAMAEQGVIEQLRLAVPASHRELWLQAEASSWQPWLEQQSGFEGRQLFWDPQREEGLLLIRWSSREQWKAIPAAEVERVQEVFEAQVNQALKRDPAAEPLFPLLAEGELQVQELPSR